MVAGEASSIDQDRDEAWIPFFILRTRVQGLDEERLRFTSEGKDGASQQESHALVIL